ncbi:MAG: 1,4-beta-xylanase [Verrucomicrobia bacterium]|nr:MAG: 1,4-beta-xylanase [Verrucomicrobiota bacterium]
MKLKIATTLLTLPLIASAQMEGQWSIERINAWYADVGAIKGCNYLPATAVNDIDMWQESSFDPETIGKELKLAHKSGYNSVRVFLHQLVWREQKEAFKKNIDTFLKIAERNKIKVMFIIFDDCNAPDEKPFIGKQNAPKVGHHNSRWVACPGLDAVDDQSRFPEYESYLKDIISTYKDDKRVIAWDLYNEPGNTGVGTRSKGLLLSAFKWAREVNPSQPLTVGAWELVPMEDELSQIMLTRSDFITFHSYNDVTDLNSRIAICKTFNRPIVNTEWLRRQAGNTFELVLPIFGKEKIGWYHWGLVQGETQTWLHWVSKKDEPKEEPWQHDMFTPDHKPYNPIEIEMVLEFEFD